MGFKSWNKIKIDKLRQRFFYDFLDPSDEKGLIMIFSGYQEHLPGSSGPPRRSRETRQHLGALSVVALRSNFLLKNQFLIQIFIKTLTIKQNKANLKRNYQNYRK